jgi:4-carboxymuconolactone decarboxylase
MGSDLYDTGMKIRRRVLGDDYVDRALAGADAFNEEFQQLVTEYCWGKVWGRSTLTDKQRSLNNLAMIAALNRGVEFKTHVRGALRNGCTVAEIRDTLLQVAVYCGIPAGVEAFKLAREVLEADGAAIE